VLRNDKLLGYLDTVADRLVDHVWLSLSFGSELAHRQSDNVVFVFRSFKRGWAKNGREAPAHKWRVTMPTATPSASDDQLQRKLREARQARDPEREVEALIDIARRAIAEDDRGMANAHFAFAAKLIRRTGAGLHRLHEVLGERALIMRGGKRLDESLDLYWQAAEAAKAHGGRGDHARWTEKQGLIHRLKGDAGAARRLFEEARSIYASLGEAGKAGLASQEGNLGLLARDEGKEEAAEAAYARAYAFAVEAGDLGGQVTWGVNFANALSRRRRYGQASSVYSAALAAADKTGDARNLQHIAEQWSVCLRHSHRLEEAAEVLIKAARRIDEERAFPGLLDMSRQDLAIAGAWARLVEIDTELIDWLEERGAPPDRVGPYREELKRSKKRLRARPAAARKDGPKPPVLSHFAVSMMAHFEESKNHERMADIAHLVCDVATGLGKPDPAAWTEILHPDFLRFRIVGDAMKALCLAREPEKSLEISQRWKSSGFSWPNLERLRAQADGPPELRDYLEGLDRLSHAVATLRQSKPDEVQQRAEAVRAEGERLLERGDLLRERDRVLAARVGALVHLQDLIDCLPLNSPVAIADIAVCHDATVVHVVFREGERVRVVAAMSPFSAADARDLLEAWAQGRVAHEISDPQREALIQIAKTLHDSLFCGLASTLAEKKLTQVILIPDPLTRHLPLHLAGVCQKNVQEVLDAIRMAPAPTEAHFFCDVFPVEYAPCLQAVAASASRKRPREIKTVVSLADPHANLAGARATALWLDSEISHRLESVTRIGPAASLANLRKDLDRANVVVIGTHGYFNSAQPADSYLEFHDGPWRMADMIDQQALRNSPVLILSSCEVGATAPTLDELVGSGIPGILLSSGAASVLATMWPVEDVSMGYVIERFLTHLSHRGFRPAAALFRAIYDLRRWPRSAALARCREVMKGMETDGRMETEQYLMLDNLALAIEAMPQEHPFDSPQFWGGITIVGSGWHASAGAITGGAEDVIALVGALGRREEAEHLIRRRKYTDAQRILEEILPFQEGVYRAATLAALARAVWGGRPKAGLEPCRREVLELLRQAEATAQDEQAAALLERIRATRRRVVGRRK
jgi:CHAT domain-containing protein